MKPKKGKKLLRKVVQELSDCKRLFSSQPKKDFTRNRKLPFEQIIKAILCMGGGSVANEMIDLFGFHEDLATTSAFVQQRAKIRPEAFEKLFDLFVKNPSERSTYRGLQLLAVDGSDFLTVSNPDDLDSFFPGTVEQKSYNLLHLNALYDLTRHVYVDALLQKRQCEDESGALVNMIDRSELMVNNILIEVMGTIAEQERLTIKRRQAEGIAAAKAKGKRFGRPAIIPPENWEQVYASWKGGEITAKTAMALTYLKGTSFYKLVRLTEQNSSGFADCP